VEIGKPGNAFKFLTLKKPILFSKGRKRDISPLKEKVGVLLCRVKGGKIFHA